MGVVKYSHKRMAAELYVHVFEACVSPEVTRKPQACTLRGKTCEATSILTTTIVGMAVQLYVQAHFNILSQMMAQPMSLFA